MSVGSFKLIGLMLLAVSGCGDNVSTSESAPDARRLDFRPDVAVIGDYGRYGPPLTAVASLVNSWSVTDILTVGDNNYPSGGRDTLDANIGQQFRRYIDGGHFFPALGNHDWDTERAAPYLEYFSLPGNERYYDVAIGNAHFFILDSDEREPDGIVATSVQAQWLKNVLSAATERWKIVLLHHSPFTSSAYHTPEPRVQWPFTAWGAHLVISGHDHFYERIERGGMTYLINGMGGTPNHYDKGVDTEGSKIWFNDGFGAVALKITLNALTASFVSTDGDVRDTVILQ
jgi:tartrate-resistant acid phosphatase type 5